MKLAAFLFGFALGAASVLWLIGRSIESATKVPAWVHDDEALPPFDPHLWRERMK